MAITRQDIVTTPSIEGHIIVAYLGIVFSRRNAPEDVFADVIQQAEALGANKIVGFLMIIQSPARCYGSGTAVVVQPRP